MSVQPVLLISVKVYTHCTQDISKVSSVLILYMYTKFLQKKKKVSSVLISCVTIGSEWTFQNLHLRHARRHTRGNQRVLLQS